MPYQTLSLEYQPDSQHLMRRLATLDRPVFLDSGTLREPQRRYDILAADPVAWLQVQAGICQSSDPDIRFTDRTIFTAIKQLQRKYLAIPESDNTLPTLPFPGGVLGFLGYPSLAGRADMRIPDAYAGVYSWAVIVDHEMHSTTLAMLPSCTPVQVERLMRLLLGPCSTDESNEPEFHLRSTFERRLSRAQYDSAFHAIRAYIQAGDCYQVNLTQQVTAGCGGSPFGAYLQLREAMPAPFSAFIGWPQGALLSASPERFVRLSGRDVLTQPIKGTRPRHADPTQDQAAALQLQGSEKDQAENLMIVDLLRNDLGRVCETGSIKANQLFTLQSFSNVHHLVSSIDARLRAEFSGIDLLQACFPGGSITGTPKLRAMEIIEELESAPRRVYCGTVFYLGSNGEMDSNITIRSLLWESGQIHCWAGGGIVDDSEADAEYAECFDKINCIIKSLAD